MPSNDIDGAIFERLRPRLKAISQRIVGSQAEAEDIVQDCFLKWHGAEQKTLATPAAWLTTVVRHQSIDRLRKRSRDAAAALTATELAPDAPPPQPEDQLLRRADLGTALARMLTRLSPAERLALVLHDVLECEHADIAAALGTSTVNARQYLARARRKLREDKHETERNEKLCRDLIRRFQSAINGADMPALTTLLAGEQPVSVSGSMYVAAPPMQIRPAASANDTAYAMPAAA